MNEAVLLPTIAVGVVHVAVDGLAAVLVGAGQAVEGVTMIMAVYLFISLAISLAMNIYNRAVALVER